MAQIQDRKSDFYSHKQSIREESLAPQYLESAGDVLVRNLAKKQLETRTTLEEQLTLTQNFEKGFELNPEQRQGISSLDELKRQLVDERGTEAPEGGHGRVPDDLESAGLSRHELELARCEKPDSQISKLYKFALSNRKVEKGQSESLESRMPDHPINHLAEIEEEYFGHLRTDQRQRAEDNRDKAAGEDTKTGKKGRKKKKHRKRKKKGLQTSQGEAKRLRVEDESVTQEDPVDDESVTGPVEEDESKEMPSETLSRPSLWGVKDMRKWCQKKEYGCKPRTLYTIRDGQIVKLEEVAEEEDVT